jgi:hypothetical protein
MKYLNCANRTQPDDRPEVLFTMVDLSDSMLACDIKPTRMEAAINANEEIIKVKSKHYYNDKIGIIVFQQTAKLVSLPVSPSKMGNIRHIIDDTDLVGGTDFVAPLKLAYNCFFGTNPKKENSFFPKALSNLFFESVADGTVQPVNTYGAVKRIILLTDGDHRGDDNPVTIATRLKDAGVIVDCIGIGGNPGAVNERLLKEIASRNSDGSVRYCFIGDRETLIRKYQTLAHHIRAI